MKDIKRAGHNRISDNGFVKGKFEWQRSYAAFSYGKPHIDQVYKYIASQKKAS